MELGKKLFGKYIRNYIGVMGLVTILLIPVYWTVYSSTRNTIISTAEGKLETVMKELDGRLARMKGFTDVVREDEYIDEIAEIRGEPETEDYYTLSKGTEAVARSILAGLDDTAQYLIFSDNPVVLSGKNALSMREMQDYEHYVLPGETFESWKEIIFGGMEKILYFPAREILWEGNERIYAITCVIKGPGVVEGYDMASVFLLDVSEWGKQADFLIVTDAAGQVLYQSGDVGEVPDGEELRRNRKINGENYIVLERESAINGIRVVAGISNQTIMERISGINRLIWLYLLLAMLGIAAYGIHFSVRKALRLQKILKHLKQEEKSGKVRNEYDYIDMAVREMWEKNDSYEEQLKEMKDSVSGSLMESLLLRGIYSDHEKEVVEKYLDWDMEFYCVVYVKGEKPEHDYAEDFFILNQYISERFSCIAANVGMNEQAYVIRMDGRDNPDTERVEAILEMAADSNRSLSMGISSIGTGLENLHVCFQQALWVNRWTSQDVSRIRIYRSNRDFPKEQGLYHLLEHYNLGNRLTDYLLLGEEGSVHEIFGKIRKTAARFPDCTETEVMQFFFEIRMPLVRIWENLGMEGEPVCYTSGTNVLSLLERLEETACFICRKVEQDKKEKEKSRKRGLVAFVDDHYMEPEMCVSYVADQFGISEKYFISCFKEEAGVGFSAYVEEKRLKLAESYLLDTNENMNRIAVMVGYNTVDAFYKSFRKNYGMAPGKWRESRRQKR